MATSALGRAAALALTCALSVAAEDPAADTATAKASAAADAGTVGDAGTADAGTGMFAGAVAAIGGALASMQAVVGQWPVVGPFVADFEPTMSNIAIVCSAVFIVHLLVRRLLFPPDANPPPFYNPGIPFFGGFLSFTRDPLGTVARAYRKHGDCFTLRMFHKKITFLVGPEAHLSFFKAVGKDYDVELDQAECYHFMTPIFGKGVVYDAPLRKRKQQFKFLSSALKASGLQTYPEVIAAETRAFLKKNWGDEGELDLLQAMQDLTILTASATLLGPEIRNALYEQVSRLYNDLDKGLSHVSVFFPHLPTEAHKRRDVARKEIVKIFGSVIRQRRKDMASGTFEGKNDLLQRLMESQYTDGTHLTDNEVTGLIIATLFAGQHTTNVTITWAIHFLAHDQKRNGGTLLERFLEEFNTLRADAPDDRLWSTLQKMKFGNACVKETVRLFPPLIFLMRAVVKKRVNAGRNNCTIPKGHTVMIATAVAMRLAEVFENPDAYEPDRWLDDEKRMALARYSFCGFGGGTHSCMGESFAYMQIKTILSVLLNEYDMTPVGDFPKANLEGMVVGPIGPCMMKYKRKVPLTSAEVAELKANAAAKKEEKAAAAAAAAAANKPARMDTVRKVDTSKLPAYTRAEVRRHCTEDDVWIIVDGLVYDVSQFWRNHPGGSEVLFAKAGEDVTKEFYGDQHPDTVPTTLEQFLVGVVSKTL